MLENFFGITVTDAVEALTATTVKLRSDYASKCFPSLPFSPENDIELGFLAVYVLDNLIKSQQHSSWQKHREAVAKGYYRSLAAKWSFGDTLFSMLYLSRLENYNEALASQLAELPGISDSEKRLVASSTILGRRFAALCDHVDDPNYGLLDSSAIGLLYVSTEKVFNSKAA